MKQNLMLYTLTIFFLQRWFLNSEFPLFMMIMNFGQFTSRDNQKLLNRVKNMFKHLAGLGHGLWQEKYCVNFYLQKPLDYGQAGKKKLFHPTLLSQYQNKLLQR